MTTSLRFSEMVGTGQLVDETRHEHVIQSIDFKAFHRPFLDIFRQFWTLSALLSAVTTCLSNIYVP